KSGANHVVGVRGPLRLGNDVLHTERFEDSAHWTTGDDAGPGRSRAQNHAARTPAAVDVVVKCPTLTKRHADQAALGTLGRLADGLRHLTRLAMAEADAALLITDDNKRGKAEALAALHNLRDAIDVNE